ncbi:cell division protein FtsZ [Neomegalonema sp.]|uniref:cell division protein FtsZ n=1 Tax=Neomegalonema sp. TaxID=2039713 RepID=UPI002612E078|nr:cell division protein FtsZ [Neomegalonema sp.]MDD2867621.1 cell division protein FtsZ [Neomegalonema sp.]
MALNLKITEESELRPRITVFGVGGAGGNAVNNMIDKGLEGVEFVVANTDAQALAHSRSARRIQMGNGVTRGLGAGMRPEVGREAAEDTIDEIIDHLAGANMCFITAGMGGGTGTGAAPVIARAAREMGVLTVGVVSKPFLFEGGKRMKLADSGIEELQNYVDTLIIIPNQNLFRVANEQTTVLDAFRLADDVLYQGVKGVTDLMVMPGLINLDFADVRTVMNEMGKAMMGTGEADGDTRAVDAAERAIANPLLDDVSLQGARGVLINITGGYDIKLFEVDEAANRIRQEVDPEANIIVGSCFDETMQGRMRVSVVATGIDVDLKNSPVAGGGDPPAREPLPPRRALPSPPQPGGGVNTSVRNAVRRAATTPYAPPPRPSTPGSRGPSETASAAPRVEPPAAPAPAAPVEARAPAPVHHQEPTPRAEPIQARAEAPAPAAAAPAPAETGSILRPNVERIVDPSVETGSAAPAPARGSALPAEAPAQPAPNQQARSSLLSGGGLDLLRRMTQSLGGVGREEPQADRRGESKDGGGDSPRDIPTFLRRQAN